jgi:hypothetical protein
MCEIKQALHIFSGALTPLIAIITVYIAYQQWVIQRNKFNLERYERRLAVFKGVRSFLNMVFSGNIDFATCSKFGLDTAECIFLFPDEVKDFIDELYKKGLRLWAINQNLCPPAGTELAVGSQRTGFVTDKVEILKWFNEQDKESWKIFRKYMKIWSSSQ